MKTSTQRMWLRGKAIAQHLGVPRFHSQHHTQGEKQNKTRSTKNRLPLALPSPFSYSTLFTHLDFPLSLAPPRFPVSPSLHYLMLTYIQGPSGRNKVCSQCLSWSLNSKGYFLFSLHLNLSPPESEVKSFSGRVPHKLLRTEQCIIMTLASIPKCHWPISTFVNLAWVSQAVITLEFSGCSHLNRKQKLIQGKCSLFPGEAANGNITSAELS